MKQTPRCPKEADEQTTLFRWAAYSVGMYPELGMMFHIPNGGTRNRIEAVHLKQQGVKSGVPDICLPVARGGFHALYIEMKRRSGGRVSEEQRGWIAALTNAGNCVKVCRGFDEAKAAIIEYLGGGA